MSGDMRIVHFSKEKYSQFSKELRDLFFKENKISPDILLNCQILLFSNYFGIDIKIGEDTTETQESIGLEDTLKDIWNKNGKTEMLSSIQGDEKTDAPKAVKNTTDIAKLAQVTPITDKSTFVKTEVEFNEPSNKEKKSQMEEKVPANLDNVKEELKIEIIGKNQSTVNDDTFVNEKNEDKKEIDGSEKDEDNSSEVDEENDPWIPQDIVKTELTKCTICNFQAASYLTLKVHIEMHHLKLRFHCTYCSFKTKEKYPARNHLRIKHNINENEWEHIDYECESCQLQEPYSVFTDHITLFHVDLRIFYDNTRMRFGKKVSKKCQFCEFEADIPSHVMMHVENTHMDITYDCKKCKKEFRSLQGIKSHATSSHRDQIDYQDKRKLPKHVKFAIKKMIGKKCNTCGKKLVHKENLIDHILLNHPDKFEKEQLRPKRGVHEKEGCFLKCQECDYSSNMRYNLKSHIMIIHMKTNFTCNECKYKTKIYGVMQAHVNGNHLENKTYKTASKAPVTGICKRCNFIANSLSEMKTHTENLHTPEEAKSMKQESENKGKPLFNCEQCDYSASLNSNFQVHIMTRHMRSNFVCNACEFKTKSYGYAIQHVASKHSDDRTVMTGTCMKCNYITNDLPQFKKHTLDNHIPEEAKAKARRKKYKTKRQMNKSSQNSGDIKCTQCNYGTTFKSVLKQHVIKSHMEPNFVCTKCQKSFKSLQFVQRHVKVDHESNSSLLMADCNACDIKGFTFSDFLEHTEKFHMSQEQVEKKKRGPKKFKSGNLKTPKLLHDQFPTFKCNECKHETTDKSEVIEHIFEQHDVNENLDEDQQLDDIEKYLIVLCKKCNFSGSYSEFNQHVALQVGVGGLAVSLPVIGQLPPVSSSHWLKPETSPSPIPNLR